MGVTSLDRKEPRTDVTAVVVGRGRRDAGFGIRVIALAGS